MSPITANRKCPYAGRGYTNQSEELTRYDVLRRVLDGTISLKAAASYMGVSYRQAKRLKNKAEEGSWSRSWQSRQSPSNRLDESARYKVLDLCHGD